MIGIFCLNILPAEKYDGIESDLSQLWRSVSATQDDDTDQPQIGDMLRARGKLQVYRGARQISCNNVSKLEIT